MKRITNILISLMLVTTVLAVNVSAGDENKIEIIGYEKDDYVERELYPLPGIIYPTFSTDISLSYKPSMKVSLGILSDQYDLVIIAPSMFSNTLQPLINHKNSHGVKTFLQTTEAIYAKYEGRDQAEQIKYAIKDAKEQWNISYVLLVGGKDLVPVRFTRICFFDENSSVIYQNYITDLYYADLYFSNHSFCSWDSNNDNIFADKNKAGYIDCVDLQPDVYVGRILTNTEAELLPIVEKIIYYENNTYGESWFKNLVVCGGDDARSLLIEISFGFLLKRFGIPVFEGEYLGNKAAGILSGFSAKKIYSSGFVRSSIKSLTINNINNAINEGAGFLMFNGHGYVDTAILTNFPFIKNLWLPRPAGYKSSDVDALTNGKKLPVAIFGGCDCGDFNVSQIPIAWKFVSHENGGAIASIACTTGAVMIQGSLCAESLHGYLLMRIFSSYAEGIDNIGKIWSDTITTYLKDKDALELGDAFSMQNWRHPLTNHYVLEQWTLFGDPSLKIGGYS